MSVTSPASHRAVPSGWIDKLRRPMTITWLVALCAAIAFWQFAKPYVPWAFKYPKKWQLPLKRQITDFMTWLLHYSLAASNLFLLILFLLGKSVIGFSVACEAVH